MIASFSYFDKANLEIASKDLPEINKLLSSCIRYKLIYFFLLIRIILQPSLLFVHLVHGKKQTGWMPSLAHHCIASWKYSFLGGKADTSLRCRIEAEEKSFWLVHFLKWEMLSAFISPEDGSHCCLSSPYVFKGQLKSFVWATKWSKQLLLTTTKSKIMKNESSELSKVKPQMHSMTQKRSHLLLKLWLIFQYRVSEGKEGVCGLH